MKIDDFERVCEEHDQLTEQVASLTRQLAEARARRIAIPTCAVTGRIAGDRDACGDCDPCILGSSAVPEPVKKLLVERDELAQKYSDAMCELAEARAERERLIEALNEIATFKRTEGFDAAASLQNVQAFASRVVRRAALFPPRDGEPSAAMGTTDEA